MLFETFNKDDNGNQVITGIGTAGNVPIEGTVTASISGTPNVNVTNTPDVHITNTPSVTVSGTVQVTQAGASAATITSVAQSASSVSLLALNANRKGFSLYNDGTKNAYIAFAATSTTTAFTMLLPPGALYESNIDYTGVMSAIWSAAGAGAMRITELS